MDTNAVENSRIKVGCAPRQWYYLSERPVLLFAIGPQRLPQKLRLDELVVWIQAEARLFFNRRADDRTKLAVCL
jgi:hypothetical protein